MYAPEPNSIISNTVHGENLIHCLHFAIDGEMAARRTVWDRVPKEDAANFESDTFL